MAYFTNKYCSDSNIEGKCYLRTFLLSRVEFCFTAYVCDEAQNCFAKLLLSIAVDRLTAPVATDHLITSLLAYLLYM